MTSAILLTKIEELQKPGGGRYFDESQITELKLSYGDRCGRLTQLVSCLQMMPTSVHDGAAILHRLRQDFPEVEESCAAGERLGARIKYGAVAPNKPINPNQSGGGLGQ
jgi:hypothetical protein